MRNFLFLIAITMGIFSQAQISITFTNVIQPCNNDGAIEAIVSGGTAPYTYDWQKCDYATYPYFSGAGWAGCHSVSTSSNVTNVVPGYYFLKVTDAINAVTRDSIFLPGAVAFVQDTMYGPSTPIFWQVSAGAPCPSPSGNLTYTISGGAPPFVFSLSSIGSQTTSATADTFFSVPIGTYTTTVTDNNGCTATCSARVNVSAGYTVNTSVTTDTCTYGTVTALPAGGLPPYTYQWIITPPQTTQTATGLFGNQGYLVQVTDANNCVVDGWGYVPLSLSPHSIQSVANIQDATCGMTDGYIAVHDTGGVPPYTYQWSNGATTDSIYNLCPGTYSVIVSDAAGCYERFTKQVNNATPIWVNSSVTPANCADTAGTDSLQVNGGFPPYTYQWSNGATTDNITNVASGYYSVLVTDQNGCLGSDNMYIPMDSLCVTYITGRVYNDMNGNCLFDNNESGLPQQIVECSNGALAYSDWYGLYTLEIKNPSSTYSITQHTKPDWSQICPATSITLTPPADTIYHIDFYDQPNPLVNDLQVFIETDSCRPGFTFNQWVSVFNNGTSTMSGTVTVQHDPILTVIGSSPATYNSSTHTFSFNFSNFAPMTWIGFNMQLQAPIGTPLFTPLTSYAVANPISGDAHPADNSASLPYRVTGSWDPNAKSVQPAGIGTTGDISTSDSVLAYTIHFQNTGSYPTSFVTILDTISSNLDIFSLRITGASRTNYQVSFPAPNVIRFFFPSLQLVPEAWDELASCGFISYTIKQKPGLTNGTQIKNHADIYFDYNTTIVTNTTLNTINLTEIDIPKKHDSFKVFPNPATDVLEIESNTTSTDLLITDILGKDLKHQTFDFKTTVDIRDLSAGMYIIKLTCKGEVKTSKAIKH